MRMKSSPANPAACIIPGAMLVMTLPTISRSVAIFWRSLLGSNWIGRCISLSKLSDGMGRQTDAVSQIRAVTVLTRM